MRPAPKPLRHRRILDLIARQPVLTQEDMARGLEKTGLRVTQATLSRDIKELGLLKGGDGYSAPGAMTGEPNPAPKSLTHMLRDFVTGVRQAQNLLVIRTTAGSAQPVAAAIDAERWPELVGTLAGDDTLLVIAASNKTCRTLGNRIRELMR